MDGRITKDDILKILDERNIAKKPVTSSEEKASSTGEEDVKQIKAPVKEPATSTRATGDEIIPMDRVRKIIAEHMVMSKRTSPHVTSFIDADMTRLMNWRNSYKDKFLAAEGQKLTLTPIFIDAVAKALPDGNLIVPVIKNANEKSLTGLAKAVNDLAERARINKLKPEEITGGTFTITNFGSYNNLAGTPIINQPQAAILGTGVVRKTPVVIETPDGDVIAIRQIIILSLSYDHRVIDGALAGKFLHKVKEILENYSPDIA
jgi:2-oxoglutarate dehydrogenase E2 component (dihydrolipoamide succinyltransferase)